MRSSNKGFALLLALIISMMVFIFGGAMVTYVKLTLESEVKHSHQRIAIEIAETGLERAKTKLQNDADWSDLYSEIFTDEPFLGGSYSVDAQNISTDSVKLTSYAVYKKATYTVSLDIVRNTNDQRYLSVDSSASTVLAPGFERVNNIVLSNLHPTKSIQITDIRLSWAPEGGEQVRALLIDSQTLWNAQNVYTPSGEQFSSTLLTLNALDLDPSGVTKSLYLIFDSDMKNKELSAYFHFADGSIKQVGISPQIGVMDVPYAGELLSIDLETADLDIPYTIGSIVLTNSGTEKISIMGLTVTIAPTIDTRLESSDVDGVEIYTNSVPTFSAFSSTLNITELTLDAGQSVTQKIQCDSGYNLEGITLNVSYAMTDFSVSNNEVLIFDLSRAFAASVTLAYLTDTKKSLRGIDISNKSLVRPFTITHVRSSWVSNNLELLNSMQFRGDVVWSFPLGSGFSANISDVDISEAETNALHRIDHNTGMIEKDFTIEYTLSSPLLPSDETATVDIRKNPNGYIADENWETQTFTGGYGFTGGWGIYGYSANLINGNTFSGDYSLELRRATSVERKVDLSSYSSVKISFIAQAIKYAPGDAAYFKISDDNKTSWQTVKTWVNEDFSGNYTYYELDLSAYSHVSDFYISFESDMDPNSRLRVDDIFLWE